MKSNKQKKRIKIYIIDWKLKIWKISRLIRNYIISKGKLKLRLKKFKGLQGTLIKNLIKFNKILVVIFKLVIPDIVLKNKFVQLVALSMKCRLMIFAPKYTTTNFNYVSIQVNRV